MTISFDLKIPAASQTRYPIFVGDTILTTTATIVNLSEFSRFIVVTDKNVAPHWLELLLKSLPEPRNSIIVEAGENHKNIQTVEQIWRELQKCGADRQSLLLNLGGGVVGDLAGFAAATYMRGIDFLQIPTTLLAQVDASVGGKVGVDFNNSKNMVGAFSQPRAVIIDVETLSTLPTKEFVAGFAEIIKHGLVFDSVYLAKVTRKAPRDFSKADLTEIILGSCKLKAKVVSEDEKEQGPRKLLNFGHTVGHAIESLSLQGDTPLLHGEAISIGMLAEARLSLASGKLAQADFTKIEEMLTAAGLPTRVPFSFEYSKLAQLMRGDKKNRNGKIFWILLEGLGRASFDNQVDEKKVKQAISYISE